MISLNQTEPLLCIKFSFVFSLKYSIALLFTSNKDEVFFLGIACAAFEFVGGESIERSGDCALNVTRELLR